MKRICQKQEMSIQLFCTVTQWSFLVDSAMVIEQMSFSDSILNQINGKDLFHHLSISHAEEQVQAQSHMVTICICLAEKMMKAQLLTTFGN